MTHVIFPLDSSGLDYECSVFVLPGGSMIQAWTCVLGKEVPGTACVCL